MGTRSGATVGIVCGLIAALIWGSGAFVSRYLVLGQLAPADLVLLRYVGCFALAVAALFVFGRHARLNIATWQFAALLMLAGPAYQFLSVSGYEFVGAGQGSVLLLGMLPVFALLISLVVTRRMPSRLAVAGVALAVAGLLVFNDLFHRTDMISAAGVAFFAVASFCWAAANFFVRRWRVNPAGLVVSLALWSPLFLPLYFITQPGTQPGANLSAAPLADIVLQIVYHGGLAAFGATALFFFCVRKVGAETAATLQVFAPCIAAALGAVLLAEPMTATQMAGAALTIVGLVVAARAGSTDAGMEGLVEAASEGASEGDAAAKPLRTMASA